VGAVIAVCERQPSCGHLLVRDYITQSADRLLASGSRRRDEVRYTLSGAKRAAARWQHCLFDGFQEGHFRGGIGGGKELADWLVLQGTLGRDDAGGDIRAG
jgi:hypothetical protein